MRIDLSGGSEFGHVADFAVHVIVCFHSQRVSRSSLPTSKRDEEPWSVELDHEDRETASWWRHQRVVNWDDSFTSGGMLYTPFTCVYTHAGIGQGHVIWMTMSMPFFL